MRTVNQSGDTPKRTGTESVYFDRPCGVHRQSIDQLAHVQEETNGMEPSRSAVLASRKNGDYQRATGPVYRASFSTGRHGRLTPRFLPVSISVQCDTRCTSLCYFPARNDPVTRASLFW